MDSPQQRNEFRCRQRWPALWLGLLAACLLTATLNAATQVRVLGWNVRNYVISDRRVDGVWREDYPKPESEKAVLRAIVDRYQPDILALQEMGELPFLRELQRDLNAEGNDYPHVFLMEGADSVRHTAVLSKLPFAETAGVTELPFDYFGETVTPLRGVLEVIFETEGTRWSLVNLHLKSRWTDDPRDEESRFRRTREAEVIRNHLRKKYPPGSSHPLLIVGDFNDHPNSGVLDRFYDVGDTALFPAIDAADSRGHVWTYYWARQQTYQRVDFLLGSPALKPFVQRAFIVDEPEPLLASDHRPLVVDLRFE
ncbi:MAG: endonuclease/exonuclease/phosphatase family protein [Opitutales bacterium]